MLRIVAMLPARYKLIGLHCGTVGQTHGAPYCEDMRLVVTLKAGDGSVIERSQTVVGYEGVLCDPDQAPWLLAATVRSLMMEACAPTHAPWSSGG